MNPKLRRPRGRIAAKNPDGLSLLYLTLRVFEYSKDDRFVKRIVTIRFRVSSFGQGWADRLVHSAERSRNDRFACASVGRSVRVMRAVGRAGVKALFGSNHADAEGVRRAGTAGTPGCARNMRPSQGEAGGKPIWQKVGAALSQTPKSVTRIAERAFGQTYALDLVPSGRYQSFKIGYWPMRAVHSGDL